MRKRNEYFVGLMGLATLGGYDLYWLYSTRQEMSRRGHHIPHMAWLACPLLGDAIILLLVELASAATRSGTKPWAALNLSLFPWLILLSTLSIFPIWLWWLWRYCGGVSDVTNGSVDRREAYAWAIILAALGLSIVWPAIIQRCFNRGGNASIELTMKHCDGRQGHRANTASPLHTPLSQRRKH